jgi:predicted lipoprotein
MVFSLASWTLTGCKIEHKSVQDKQRESAPAGGYENTTFNPDAEVQTMWLPKVVPALDKMAVNFRDLKKEMAGNLDAAGNKHGHREGNGDPWNLAVKVTGKVVDAETDLRAGTADVDVDGDGKADVQLQIGPVIKGTTLRDVLPFISFTSYANQIDFARLANALNDQAYAIALKSMDRATLKGKTVDVIGVFTAGDAAELPLVTVTSLKVSEK